ncbi:SapC family protein [Desulfobulbus rhabdoformis]|jgi:hypothetical protein|uniref:SapC family protein n=1 Tax=Desulfobulbus rhabdoformis TaxID=34032 RepID=UPI001963793D|nr:SapC family protein [Desulfobulbus rhabdoformis]MBM9613965.1 SapC family protein [Desulfobulbus rhabdoformis]
MFNKLVPLQSQKHVNTKIKNIQGFAFAQDFHLASVMVHEFVRAASLYPIVFIEDTAQDQFKPIVLLGLEAKQNLFVDAEGKWQASYIPAIIRRYPFALVKGENQEQLTVCIDEESEIISEDEGVPLFHEDGSTTDALENVKRYLSELHQMEVITTEFCKFMSENNMFAPLNMRVRQSDQVQNIAGCYVINEERLKNLSDERFLELRKKGFLPAVYAHLVSLSQIERLTTLASGAQSAPSDNALERIAEEAETTTVIQ